MSFSEKKNKTIFLASSVYPVEMPHYVAFHLGLRFLDFPWRKNLVCIRAAILLDNAISGIYNMARS